MRQTLFFKSIWVLKKGNSGYISITEETLSNYITWLLLYLCSNYAVLSYRSFIYLRPHLT